MAVCLPKSNREKLVKALKSGEISLAKLYQMTDAERNIIFKQYVGKDFASFVNAKFEQAMLSNQKKALANWIQRTTLAKDPVRRDMLKKVEGIKKFLVADEEKGFLKDLAELKLGLNITEEEAKTILNFKLRVDDLKTKISENSPRRSSERMAYGYALDDFKTSVGKLKAEAEAITFLERIKPTNYWQNIVDLAGVTKSLVATLDNSFIGRQGIKVLLRGNYGIWARTFVESFKNMGRELVAKSGGLFKERSDAAMRAIRADIYSRPNALNGKYKAAQNGYGLGVLHEEIFPTSLPERIPLLGRIFKAAETAFNGSAIRMRADLADAIIANAEKAGVDMLDGAQASAHARLVTSMTGRGELGRVGAIGREINVLMFSVRFLKSNLDTITAHLLDKTFTPEARKAAALSTLRIAGSLTALLTIAKMLGTDVEFDPRKGRIGRIGIGGRDFDISGGMGGLITLGSRIVPTFHNGEFGFWRYSPSTKKWTKMTGENFGEITALDTFEQFWEGKLSPSAGMVRDIWRGQNFQGEKPTFVNTILGLITPISAEMFIEELNKGNDDVLLAMIAEGLGISPTDRTMRGYGKKWQKLKEKKGDEIFNQSLKQATERFNERAERLQKSSRWERMDNDARSKELDKIRREETERIFNRYGID